ncbi:MAG: alginate O-acetyltransferase [Spirochaetales bacterium]|nr:MAG: alginate O-acetyltransferase [Spirochaetales bacterium]
MRTSSSRDRYKLLGLVALLVAGLAAGGATLVNTRVERPTRQEFVNGQAADRLRIAFDGALPFKEIAAQLVAGLRYGLFGEGFKGVLVGENGWLFSSEEFEADLGFLPEDPRVEIGRVRDRLAALGIVLVIAPVPAKVRIYGNELGERWRDVPFPWRYAAILDLLDDLDVAAPDLASAFIAQADAFPLFLRTDTHWGPAGARLAAREIADTVIALPQASGLSRLSCTARVEGIATYPGDLLAFLPRHGVPWRPLPRADTLDVYKFDTVGGDEDGNEADLLFGAQEIPVALVGTSYSAESSWGFDGFLKEALGMDVLNLAEEGEGPFQPMNTALESGVLEENGIRVVIWEIPERYLPAGSLL